MSPARFVTVARTGEVPPGGRRVVRVDGLPVLILHLEDGWVALDDVCTHDGGPLAEGELADGVIECPRHGARFDVRTGAVRRFPAMGPITTYPVRIAGDEIQLEWP